MIVPFDSETGMALPNAVVEAVTLTERPAIIEAQIYRYITDREAYNQLDNDLRVRAGPGAIRRRRRQASMRALWTSGHESYPPQNYGERRPSWPSRSSRSR